MTEHPIESLMQTAMYNIEEMIDVDTIIGEPIESANGTTIIPISKVCFGFAAGGSDFKEEVVEEYQREDKLEKIKARNPFGGGAGAGVKIAPVGFLIVESKQDSFPRFIPVEHECAIDKILDYVPDLFQKLEKLFLKSKKNEEEEKTEDDIEEKVEEKKDNMNNKRKAQIEKEYFQTETPVQSDGEDL